MTTEALQTAIERIESDPELARRIYEDAAVIGELDLDLEQVEIEAMHQALVVDVQNSLGEVTAFSALDWPSMTFPQLAALNAAKREGGKVQLEDIVVTKEVDKASPG